jgi:hypothetical protein
MIYNKTFQDWLDFEIHWIVKERSRAGGPRREFWVLLRWLKNLWFILLTSSTLLYVRLTFLHNQTRWSHVSCTCVVPHHECEGWWSDLFHGSHLLGWILTCNMCAFRMQVIRRMACSIFQDEEVMGCDVATVCHTCAFCFMNMRGKDTLHSIGGCLRLDAVHAAAWCMDTISIVNGNVCGPFHDVLARKVLFCRYTNHVSAIALNNK